MDVNLKLYWMDGGIAPDRPDELEPDVNMNDALAFVPEENILKGELYSLEQKEKLHAAGAEVIRNCCRFH